MQSLEHSAIKYPSYILLLYYCIPYDSALHQVLNLSQSEQYDIQLSLKEVFPFPQFVI